MACKLIPGWIDDEGYIIGPRSTCCGYPFVWYDKEAKYYIQCVFLEGKELADLRCKKCSNVPTEIEPAVCN